jgi:site-specific DNA-methyltransferase (adenine-specific)
MHWNGGGLPGFWSYVSKSREREWIHPTEKPLALMLKLVEQFSDEGETILDPFSGSASTGVAAIRLGRRFLGAELDPGYHAAALERLQAECLGLGLTDFRRGQQALFSAGDIAGTVRET